MCEATGLSRNQLSQWISRGHYRPSQEVRRGQGRLFDWRDLACLAVMGELRALSLEPHKAERLIGELRGLLQQRRFWSGTQLTERLGVTTRTVRQDAERLRGLGYRVQALPGVEGGYHLEAGPQIRPWPSRRTRPLHSRSRCAAQPWAACAAWRSPLWGLR